MKVYQKQLLDMLYHSMIGEKYSCTCKKEIKWEKIIDEAIIHDISALIYSSIDKDTLIKIDKDILNKWKVNILKSNITQIHILKCAKEIFSGLQEKGIQVIALKGLILKNFYPRPEFRTMSDLDILIDIRDYNTVEEYLNSIGYFCKTEITPIHGMFYNESGVKVEVHWNLIDKDYYSGQKYEFDKNIWKNAKEINIYGIKLKTLSYEDFLIHICMHMSVHAKYRGFGLRQLYDLALFTKDKYEDIDWANFKYRISKYGILTFTEALYIMCSKLFKISVPFGYLDNDSLKEKHIKLFLENIVYSGVKGRRINNIYFNLPYMGEDFGGRVKKIIQIIFVNRKELSPRYNYAQKHYYLLPIAWIHRIFRAFIKHGVIKMIKYTKQVVREEENKNRIVNILKI